MQVEETVYNHTIKCTHSFSEKCHNTFVTDYVPTQERKCDTSFEKKCDITYQPTAFNKTVEICDEPLKKVCDDSFQGEEVCNTKYETSCETTYNEHEAEQDEPVCKMVTERKCNGVLVQNSTESEPDESIRTRRSAVARIENGTLFKVGELENCEEWQIQKCTVEKKLVKKTHPETSCKKHPRQVCAPSNCKFV